MSVSRYVTEISAQNPIGPREAPQATGPPGFARPTTSDQICCRMCSRWFPPEVLDDAKHVENANRGRTFRVFLLADGSIHRFAKADLEPKPKAPAKIIEQPIPAEPVELVQMLSALVQDAKQVTKSQQAVLEKIAKSGESATLGDVFKEK